MVHIDRVMKSTDTAREMPRLGQGRPFAVDSSPYGATSSERLTAATPLFPEFRLNLDSAVDTDSDPAYSRPTSRTMLTIMPRSLEQRSLAQ